MAAASRRPARFPNHVSRLELSYTSSMITMRLISIRYVRALALTILCGTLFVVAGCDSGGSNQSQDQPPGEDGGQSSSGEVTVISSFIDSDRTLTPDKRYRMAADINPTVDIIDGATLTIKPGVEIIFEENVSLQVNNGSLVADGTAEKPIVMKATDGNEQPGWWRGVDISTGDNVLNHVTIRHAGANTVLTTDDQAASITFNGVDEGALSLTNSTIADGAGHGLEFLSGPDDAIQDFSDNTFSNIEEAPVRIPFRLAGTIGTGTSLPADAAVHLYGQSRGRITSDLTITPLGGDTPYRFTEMPRVNSGATLTIKPGVDLTFDKGTGIRVSALGDDPAAFVAEGTAQDSITMTAPAGKEQQGWWKGIGLVGNQTTTLENVVVRHAGRGSFSSVSEAAGVALGENIAGAAGSLNLLNSTIEDSGNHGVYCEGDSASLNASGNTFNNNAGQNVKSCN